MYSDYIAGQIILSKTTCYKSLKGAQLIDTMSVLSLAESVIRGFPVGAAAFCTFKGLSNKDIEIIRRTYPQFDGSTNKRYCIEGNDKLYLLFHLFCKSIDSSDVQPFYYDFLDNLVKPQIQTDVLTVTQVPLCDLITDYDVQAYQKVLRNAGFGDKYDRRNTAANRARVNANILNCPIFCNTIHDVNATEYLSIAQHGANVQILNN